MNMRNIHSHDYGTMFVVYFLQVGENPARVMGRDRAGYACVTPEPHHLQPPVPPFLWSQISWGSERSQILTARDPSPALTKN